MKLEYGTKSLEYDGSGTASATKVTLVNAAINRVCVGLNPTGKVPITVSLAVFPLLAEPLR